MVTSSSWRSKLQLHSTELKTWLAMYNRKETLKLAFHEEIVKALFVVKVDNANLVDAKEAFLVASSLHAINQFASVNSYPKNFDPQNPINFCHLVTITIM